MRARVLVVDDDPALAEMLGIVLRSEGFLPSFVADGGGARAAGPGRRPGKGQRDPRVAGERGRDGSPALPTPTGRP
ncbi:DNA-binding response regulator, partial [Actinoplanes sp. NPDC051633]